MYCPIITQQYPANDGTKAIKVAVVALYQEHDLDAVKAFVSLLGFWNAGKAVFEADSPVCEYANAMGRSIQDVVEDALEMYMEAIAPCRLENKLLLHRREANCFIPMETCKRLTPSFSGKQTIFLLRSLNTVLGKGKRPELSPRPAQFCNPLCCFLVGRPYLRPPCTLRCCDLLAGCGRHPLGFRLN